MHARGFDADPTSLYIRLTSRALVMDDLKNVISAAEIGFALLN